MKLVYGFKNKVINFSEVSSSEFSNELIKVVDFDPVDLYMELAMEDSSFDADSYVMNFIDNDLGDNKQNVISEIINSINEWKNYSPKYMEEKVAKDGALLVEKIFKKHGLIT